MIRSTRRHERVSKPVGRVEKLLHYQGMARELERGTRPPAHERVDLFAVASAEMDAAVRP